MQAECRGGPFDGKLMDASLPRVEVPASAVEDGGDNTQVVGVYYLRVSGDEYTYHWQGRTR